MPLCASALSTDPHMSLDRLDIRAKVNPTTHAKLKAIAEVDGRDIGEIIEELVSRYVERRVHEATLLAEKLSRLGRTGNNRE